jgi:hypothetical protein
MRDRREGTLALRLFENVVAAVDSNEAFEVWGEVR